MQQWLDGQTIFGIKIEKQELPRSGGRAYYSMPTDGGIFVVHTTQGGSVAGALSTLAANNDGPHFVGGEGRLIQCRPIGVQGASLHAPQNQYPVIQIECVGFSKTTLYSLPDPTNKPLVALLAWASQNLGVPLVRPSALWKDDMSDCPLPWAANNKRRQEAVWPSARGVYGHIEVTGQAPTWHYDPGALNYTQLLADAQTLIDSNQDNQLTAEQVSGGAVGGMVDAKV